MKKKVRIKTRKPKVEKPVRRRSSVTREAVAAGVLRSFVGQRLDEIAKVVCDAAKAGFVVTYTTSGPVGDNPGTSSISIYRHYR